MRIKLNRLSTHKIVTIFLGLCWGSSVYANWVVVYSNVSTYSAGQIITADEQVLLDKSGLLKLVSVTGDKRSLEGPFKDRLGASDAVIGNSSQLTKLAQLLQKPQKRVIGATREILLLAHEKTAHPSEPWVIDIMAQHQFCFIELDNVSLWRPSVEAAMTVTLQMSGSDQAISVELPPGVASVDFPAAIQWQNDSVLQVKLSGGIRSISLQRIPGNIKSDIDRALWMADYGCEQQGRLLLVNSVL